MLNLILFFIPAAIYGSSVDYNGNIGEGSRGVAVIMISFLAK
jgi:hypothetical protein